MGANNRRRAAGITAAVVVALTAACTGGQPASGPASSAPALADCPNGSEPILMAFAPTTGAARWQTCSTMRAWRRVVAVTEQTVLVVETTETTGADGTAVQRDELVAIAAESGQERWRVALAVNATRPAAEHGPVSAAGIVVTVSPDGREIVGLDEMTGQSRWAVAAENIETPVLLPDGTAAQGPGGVPLTRPLPFTIIHTEQSAIVPTSDGLAALDRANGSERWRNPAVEQPEAAVDGTIITYQRNVPVGTMPQIVGVDAASGDTIWQTASRLYGWQSAAGTLVGRLSGSRVSAIDPDSGQLRWTNAGTPSYGGSIAITASQIVLFEDDSWRTIVSYATSNGSVLWRRSVDATLVGQPQVAHANTIYLLGGGRLTALDAAGATIWTARTPAGALESSAAAHSSGAYVTFNTMPWRD